MVINQVPFEDDEHIAFVQWIEYQHPTIDVIHVANGELRDSNRQRAVMRGAKLKRMGVKKGVWDLFMPDVFLWVEMKRQKGGSLTPEQKEFRNSREKAGYVCLVANGWLDGKEKVQEFLKGDIPCLTLNSRSPYSLELPSGLPVSI